MKDKYINKLNKKDREEMLSRIKIVRDKSYYGIGVGYINIFVKYIILLSIVIPLWFIAFEAAHKSLLIAGMTLFMAFGKIILFLIVIGFFIDYVIFFIRSIKIIRIKRSYFNIVPKRK